MSQRNKILYFAIFYKLDLIAYDDYIILSTNNIYNRYILNRLINEDSESENLITYDNESLISKASPSKIEASNSFVSSTVPDEVQNINMHSDNPNIHVDTDALSENMSKLSIRTERGSPQPSINSVLNKTNSNSFKTETRSDRTIFEDFNSDTTIEYSVSEEIKHSPLVPNTQVTNKNMSGIAVDNQIGNKFEKNHLKNVNDQQTSSNDKNLDNSSQGWYDEDRFIESKEVNANRSIQDDNNLGILDDLESNTNTKQEVEEGSNYEILDDLESNTNTRQEVEEGNNLNAFSDTKSECKEIEIDNNLDISNDTEQINKECMGADTSEAFNKEDKKIKNLEDDASGIFNIKKDETQNKREENGWNGDDEIICSKDEHEDESKGKLEEDIFEKVNNEFPQQKEDYIYNSDHSNEEDRTNNTEEIQEKVNNINLESKQDGILENCLESEEDTEKHDFVDIGSQKNILELDNSKSVPNSRPNIPSEGLASNNDQSAFKDNIFKKESSDSDDIFSNMSTSPGIQAQPLNVVDIPTEPRQNIYHPDSRIADIKEDGSDPHAQSIYKNDAGSKSTRCLDDIQNSDAEEKEGMPGYKKKFSRSFADIFTLEGEAQNTAPIDLSTLVPDTTEKDTPIMKYAEKTSSVISSLFGMFKKKQPEVNSLKDDPYFNRFNRPAKAEIKVPEKKERKVVNSIYANKKQADKLDIPGFESSNK